jgi:hypothetical protein
MVVEIENRNTEESRSEFPEVPDEAIVKPEDERPAKMSKRLKKSYQVTKINTMTKV